MESTRAAAAPAPLQARSQPERASLVGGAATLLRKASKAVPGAKKKAEPTRQEGAPIGVDGAPAVKLDSGAAVSDELSSMLLADGSCPIGLTDEEQLVGSALHPV